MKEGLKWLTILLLRVLTGAYMICAVANKRMAREAGLTTSNMIDNRRLYQLVQDLNLPYFELIGKKYDFRWLHISYNPERAKRNPS